MVPLKNIEAIIRSGRLNDVKEALAEAGFRLMTVTSVKGRGRQMGLEFDFRGRKFRVDLIPKCKIELIVREENVDKVVDIIKSARTGKKGESAIT